jgi:hypothetical protein
MAPASRHPISGTSLHRRRAGRPPDSRQDAGVTCLLSKVWLLNSARMLLMANLTLVYGMRLLPSEEVAEVGDATLKLKNGREAHVTMHVLEGSKEEIEKQLKTSLEAFFDFYPEI